MGDNIFSRDVYTPALTHSSDFSGAFFFGDAALPSFAARTKVLPKFEASARVRAAVKIAL